MSMIQFFTTTQAKYDAAVKDANALYFCEDTQVLFKGDKRYGFEVITGRPATVGEALRGVLYIHDDNKVYCYNGGDDWVEAGVLAAYVDQAEADAIAEAKRYTDGKIAEAIANVYRFKGIKATAEELPAEGNVTGDVWHVSADNSEYVWNGTAWEKLGFACKFEGTADMLVAYDGAGGLKESGKKLSDIANDISTAASTAETNAKNYAKELADGKIDKVTGADGKVATFTDDGNVEGVIAIQDTIIVTAGGDVTQKDDLPTIDAVVGYVEAVVTGGISVDLRGKANKVTDGGAKMEGNLAGLDAEGDLTDSLVAAGAAAYDEATFGKSDVEGRTLLATEKAVTEYAEGTFAKQVAGTENDIVFVGADGQVKDSGKSVVTAIGENENVPTAKAVKDYVDDSVKEVSDRIPDISGKADKVADAVSGNLAGLDAEGNLTDSGFKGGSATLGSAANVLATEAAVVTALTWKTL